MTGYKSKKTAARDNQDIVWKPLKGLGVAPDNFYTIKLPEQSEWKCYLFGNTPQENSGIVWIPIKGQEPNWFVRWMMKVCFACIWVKEKNNG